MSVAAPARVERETRLAAVAPGPSRVRRAARASVAMAGGSAVSFFVAAAVVPVTIGYLGPDRFGVWMAAVAMVGLLDPLDFGVGSALVTRLASSDAADGRELVRAATRWLVGCSVAIATVAGVASFAVDWGGVLNASEATARSEALPVLVVVLVGFCLSLPLSVVDRVNLALQEGHRVGITTAIGHLVSLVLLVVLALVQAGVPYLAAALVGGPLVARLVAGVRLRRRRRELFSGTSTSGLDAATARRLLVRTGGLFFGLQVAVVVAFGADQVVISRVLGAAAVPEYAVPARMFALVSAAALLVARPLWPAYADAVARGDGAWAGRTLRRSCGLTVIGAMAVVVPLVWFGSDVVDLVGRERVSPSQSVLVAFGVWTVLQAWGAPVAAFLNGIGVVRMQLVASALMAATNLALSIVLARRIGVAGVVWGSVIAYSLCIVVPYSVLLPRLVRRLEAVR